MFPTRHMRLLRLKYQISVAELARAAKISPQRVSQIELASERSTEYQRALMFESFLIVADERRDSALRRDLRRLEYSLLETIEEGSP